MKLLRHVFKERVNGRSIAVGGLEPHEPDERDFRYQDLGGILDYKPKQNRLVLPIIEIKDQMPNNTCVFHAYAACREQQEGVALSPRSLVAYAKANGLLRADGLSNLRNGQKAGHDYGIAEESLVPNDNLDWRTYSSVSIEGAIAANAADHKSKSYFSVNTQSEWLKALDDGHAIHTGFDWYSSYNMTGGLKSPWILPWRRGYRVGGHAVACVGYDWPNQLMVLQNSFGRGWGDEGLFYIRMDNIFGHVEGFVAVDMDDDKIDAFLASHEGKDVRSGGRPAIYRIENGKKRAYPDPTTFYAWGGHFECDGDLASFQIVSDKLLDLAPDGDPMRAEESPNWQFLSTEWDTIRWMTYPDSVNRIKKLIKL